MSTHYGEQFRAARQELLDSGVWFGGYGNLGNGHTICIGLAVGHHVTNSAVAIRVLSRAIGLVGPVGGKRDDASGWDAIYLWNDAQTGREPIMAAIDKAVEIAERADQHGEFRDY